MGRGCGRRKCREEGRVEDRVSMVVEVERGVEEKVD